MDKLSIQHHISHLEEKHSKLDWQLHSAIENHANDVKVVDLKKQKLAVKDEIQKFKIKLGEAK